MPCIWYLHDIIDRKRLCGIVNGVLRLLIAFTKPHIVATSDLAADSLPVIAMKKVILPVVEEKKHEIRIDLRRCLGLESTAHVVGFVGRISYNKGLDILVKASMGVVYRNESAHFVVVGGAANKDRNYHRNLLKKIGRIQLASHWHWLGYRENIHPILEQMDMLVLPSRKEAFALTLLEA